MNLQTKIFTKEQNFKLKIQGKEMIFNRATINYYNNQQIQLLSVHKLERSKMKKWW